MDGVCDPAAIWCGLTTATIGGRLLELSIVKVYKNVFLAFRYTQVVCAMKRARTIAPAVTDHGQ